MKRISLLFLLFWIFFVPPVRAQTTCPTLPTNTGTVTLSTSIPATGSYKIWSRIKPSATDINANSFWLQFGTQCGIKVGDSSSAIPANTWTWVDFQNGDTNQKVIVSLSSGNQVVKIIGNEQNVGVDKIVILDSTSTCIPTDLGDNCQAVATLSPTAVLTPTTSPTLPPTATKAPTTTPTKAPTPIPTNTPAPTSTPVPPTATPQPNSTKFGVTLLLHGLGKGGDNANPTATGNTTPLHPQKTITLQLFDSSNTLVKSVSGTVNYNATLGNFQGTVDGGTDLASGSYLVKVKSVPYLRRQLGGIVTITAASTNTLPQGSLVVGDTNDDNQLNILDYNMMLDCYSELAPARNCDPSKLTKTDFNDDGAVNQFDYNLFLRELSVLTGQ